MACSRVNFIFTFTFSDCDVTCTGKGECYTVVLPSLNLGSRNWWLVSAKALPLYPVKGCYVPANIWHTFRKCDLVCCG